MLLIINACWIVFRTFLRSFDELFDDHQENALSRFFESSHKYRRVFQSLVELINGVSILYAFYWINKGAQERRGDVSVVSYGDLFTKTNGQQHTSQSKKTSQGNHSTGFADLLLTLSKSEGSDRESGGLFTKNQRQERLYSVVNKGKKSIVRKSD